MEHLKKLQQFENRPIRTAWDAEREEWLFSVVDVVGALTEQENFRSASNYWAKLKERLLKESGAQLLTFCQQLKLASLKDGKKYNTDVATTRQLQSVKLASEV